MASGTFSNTSSAWQVKIEYSTTDDAANNRTYVAVTLYGRRTDQASGSNGACFQPSITINGSTSGGSYYTTEYTSWNERHSYGTYVSHNNDGSKSITISGSIYKAPGSPSTTQDGVTKTASGTITLTTYETTKTLTLSKGTGISSTSGGGSYKEGTSVSINATVSSGYTWNKWTGSTSYLADTTGKTKATTVTMPASAISLTANATANTYTVTWDAQGGTPSGGSTSVSYNSTYSIPSCSKAGHTFNGWYTATSGGAQITTSTKHTTAGNVTYYAQYTPWTFTVKYNANGGEGSAMSNSSHTHGTSSNLTACTYTKPGYSFTGWNTKSDGTGNTYADSDNALTMAVKESLADKGSITLYAQWGIKGIKFYNGSSWIVGRVKLYTGSIWV